PVVGGDGHRLLSLVPCHVPLPVQALGVDVNVGLLAAARRRHLEAHDDVARALRLAGAPDGNECKSNQECQRDAVMTRHIVPPVPREQAPQDHYALKGERV
ncbi:MAG: hypothetical protein PVH68_09825, partial [Armatimonadota bacterium]